MPSNRPSVSWTHTFLFIDYQPPFSLQNLLAHIVLRMISPHSLSLHEHHSSCHLSLRLQPQIFDPSSPSIINLSCRVTTYVTNVTPSHSTAQCYIITAVKFYTLLQKYTLCAVLVSPLFHSSPLYCSCHCGDHNQAHGA